MSDYCDLSQECQMREYRRRYRERQEREAREIRSRINRNIPVTYTTTVTRNVPVVGSSPPIVSNLPVTSSGWKVNRPTVKPTQEEVLTGLEFPIQEREPETVLV